MSSRRAAEARVDEPPRRLALAALAVLAALLLSCPVPWRAESLELAPGRSWLREAGDGKTLQFRFRAAAGQFLYLTVEQRDVDVALLLRDPAGRPVFEADTPSGPKGPESLWIVTPRPGEYRLMLRSLKTEETGSVLLAVRELRPARPADRLRTAAEEVWARAELRRGLGDFEAAAPAYREAIPHLLELKDGRRAALAQWRLGEALAETGRPSEAVPELRRAAARFEALHDGVAQARALNTLGTAWGRLGELRPALEAYREALRLYRAAGNLDGTAQTRSAIGQILRESGDLDGALGELKAALALWEGRPEVSRPARAAVLENLGKVYTLLGHDREALDVLRQALRLLDGKENLQRRASTLLALGTAEYLEGLEDRALERLQEAAELAEKAKDPGLATAVWQRRGAVLRDLGRYEEAAKAFERALALARSTENRYDEALILADLGWLDPEIGEPARARERLEPALAALSRRGDLYREAYVRMGLSRAERALGNLKEARAQAEAAVRLFDRTRATLRGESSRGQFSSTRFNAYEELVSLLMDLDRREPGRGHDLEALELAERSRARNLLDGLAGAGGAPEAGPADEPRRQTLLREIPILEERRQALVLQDPHSPGLKAIEADLRARWLELDRLAPPPSARPLAPPLTAQQMQGLVDENSVLVVYLLAEPQSFAWTVGRDRIEAHTLPGRKQIERLARRAAEGLAKGEGTVARKTLEATLAELSRAVLEPLAARLEGRQTVVILADGALHRIPFAALPDPASARAGRSEPLLVRHEIAMLPSATFLFEQRRRLAGRPPAPKRLAVLADPLYLDSLRRLPYTGEEARAIVRLVPRDQALLALGAAASRDLVMSGALRDYRILHFATHGILDPVLPERSGIMLSQFDAQGRGQTGFLSAPAVAGLDLRADLIVLSGCETGLGREVRGEGLVGLPQGFFRAGARRVVVSLWKVRDSATAELMSRLYHHLLLEGRPPAAALRAAQLSFYQDDDLHSPYFWAGFTLQGDWK
jgi:CHAT domain-containing protein/tetratricopeptide (TPR) repeat protein